jgi:membrane-bound lytic murein transglycosylase D
MPCKPETRLLLIGFLAGCASPLLLSQQSGFQTSFFAPAAVRLPATGVTADIADTEHLPYINQVAKETQNGLAAFRPNASDLLIDQAEARFQSGKRFYRQRNFDQARQDFDAAIDLMLKAAENPTDRALFECKLEDMVDTIHRDDLAGFGAAAVETSPQFDKAPLEDIALMTFPVDPKIKDKVQTEMKTIASALPLEVNDVVLGYINFFNSKGRRTIEYGFERAGKYEPMISKIFAEEGIPQELIHLAQAESGFLPRAVSRAAAEGMWQFVKSRGNQYGLMQTPYSDDRLDPEKATRAAAHHLHDLFNEFHDWYLAMAAYNCGPGNVERAVERTGYADYWELRARHALPNETANYVPIILAMTIMSKNASEYGLDHLTLDTPLEYDTLRLTSTTNLALIGDLTDTPLPQLQQLNPALLRATAPAGYDLRLPKGSADQVQAALEKVPAEVRASSRMHRVEAGENLAAIARRYNASVGMIASVNTGTQVAEGDLIVIPAAYRETVAAPARTAKRPATSSGRRAATSSARRPATLSTARPAATTAHKAMAKPAGTVAITNSPAPHKTTGTVAQLHKPASTVSR